MLTSTPSEMRMSKTLCNPSASTEIAPLIQPAISFAATRHTVTASESWEARWAVISHHFAPYRRLFSRPPMIRELIVENIAVIERSTLRLGPGFTVLTGETGAGKSLLVDAIGLALGARADSDLVRAGAARGVVGVYIELARSAAARAALSALSLPNEGTLVVQREVTAEGRSNVRLNGKLTQVGVLRSLGTSLVDLHGQHDHQALLDSERHIESLDAWIGEPARALIGTVREAFEAWQTRSSALMALRRGLRERSQRLEMLQFQIQEISGAGLTPGELDDLNTQIGRLQHSEKIREAVSEVLGALRDEEGAALDRLGDGVRQLEGVVRYDDSLEPVIEDFRSLMYSLQDSVMGLAGYAEALESDPGLLDELLDRRELIQKLLKKYGASEAEVLAYLTSAEAEWSVLEEGEAGLEELERQVEVARKRLDELCRELSALRRESAREFSASVEAELHELAMEKARFAVELQPVDPGPNGTDAATFLFSANTGEPVRPLHKIASGGEMSRVMLALKVVLAGKSGPATLIFDEIDTGLSGRAAAVVARKLQELSRFYQVISISHLPQLAGRADVHFRIEKVEEAGRTYTQVRELDGEERIEEIARMLAGEQIGDFALANARELLAGRG